MHIGHVVRQFHPARGGLEEFVKGLADQQAKAGHSVKVITCNRNFQDLTNPLPARDIIGGIEIQRIPFSGSRRYPIAPKVLRLLPDLDLVHVHGVDFFFDFLALTRAAHGKPLVATTHGGFFHTRHLSRLKSLWFQTLTRASIRGYRSLVACSDSDYELFRSVSPPEKLVTIQNGVDIAKYRGASRIWSRRLLTLGRFSDNKRLDHLLDMFQELTKIDQAWILDICGIESDWSAERLGKEIAQRGLSKSVNVVLGASDERLRNIISEASIFVSASEYEGFGIALIEAMSAGLFPIVQGNTAYQAFERAFGHIDIDDFRSARSVAARIQDVWRNCSDPEALKRRSMEIADEFGWPSVASRYEAVYRQVLSGGEPSA